MVLDGGATVDEPQSALLAPRLIFLPSSPLLLLLLPGPPAELRLWDLREPSKPPSNCLWGGSDSLLLVAPLCLSAFALLGAAPGDDPTPTLRAACLARGGAIEPRDWSFSLPPASRCAAQRQPGTVLTPCRRTPPCSSGAAEDAFVAALPQPGAADGSRLLLASLRGSLTLLDLPSKRVLASAASPDWEEGDGDSFDPNRGALALVDACWISETLAASAQRNGTVRLWKVGEASAPARPASITCCAQLRVGEGGEGDELERLLFEPSAGGGEATGALLCLVAGELWSLPVLARPSGVALAPPARAAPGAPRLRRLALSCPPSGPTRLLALASHGPAMWAAQLAPPPMRLDRLYLSICTGDARGAACVASGEEAAPLLLALRARAVIAAQQRGPPLLPRLEALPATPCRLLATAHAGGVLRLWEASGECLSPLLALRAPAEEGAAAPSEIACFDLCPRAALLLAARADGGVTLHALDAGGAAVARAAARAPPALCALATRLRLAAVVDEEGWVQLLSLPTLVPFGPTPDAPLLAAPRALAWLEAADGPMLAVLGDEEAALLPIGGGAPLRLRCSGGGAALALAPLDAMGQLCGPLGGAMEAHPTSALPRPPTEEGAEEEEVEDRNEGSTGSLLLVAAEGACVYRLGEAAKPRRTQPHPPALFAAAFAAPGGAVLALLLRSSELLLLTAQTLQALRRAPMEEVCGLPAACRSRGGGPSFSGDTPSLLCLGRDGQLLSVWRDARGEPLPLLHRSELLEEFSAPSPPPEWGAGRYWLAGRGAAEEEEEEEAPGSKGGSGGGGAGGFFARMKEKGMEALKRSGGKARKALSGDDWASVFPPFALASTAQPAGRPGGPPARVSKLTVGAPLEPSGAAARGALLGEGRPAAAAAAAGGSGGGGGGGRTADDIRAKYGFARKAEHAMAENVEKLNERGEKLMNIQEKTARMEAEAAEFAASAKLLAEKQSLRGMLGW